MNYCSQCGAKVSVKVPPNDDRERHVCDRCGFVHYQNPKIVAGCFVTHKNRVLLCRRSIPPEKGLWTLPGGFMENGESSEQAAKREAWEEARAEVRIDELYFLIDFPQLNQVYLIYRGVQHGFNTGRSGSESGRVGLFGDDEIPWDELAFEPVIRMMLEHYVSDRKSGRFTLRNLTIDDLNLWDKGR